MDTWDFFQNSRGLWRWRCTSADGTLVSNSAEAYSLRVQAVANAITHGFVDGGSQVDANDALEVLKRRYQGAFAVYEGRLSLLTETSNATSNLREDVAKAFHELESARRDYREALLQAVGTVGSEI